MRRAPVAARRSTALRAAWAAALLILAACVPAPPPDPDPDPDPSAARVWYVDNRAEAPPTGDRASPFAALDDAATAAGPGDTIFVFAGDGSALGLEGNVALKDDQRLIGEGVGLPDEGIEAGAAPTLAGVVTLAQGNVVAGLRIEGAAGGIVGAAVGPLTLHDLAIVGAGGDGIRIEATTGVARIGAHGLEIVGSAGAGLLVRSQGGASLHLELRDSRFEGNLGSALQIDLFGAGDGSFALADLDIRTLAASGIRAIVGGPASSEVEGRIVDSVVTLDDPGGAGSGVTVLIEGDADAAIVLSDNRVSGFGSFGVDLAARGGSGALDATLTRNRLVDAAANALAGMRLHSGNGSGAEGSALCLALSGNQTVDAVLGGYLLRQRAGTDFRLAGFGGDGSDPAAVASFVASRNQGDAIVSGDGPGTVPTFGGGACRQPIF